MKKLLTRTGTGIIYIGLILLALLSQSTIPFAVIFGIFVILGISEFNHLTQQHENRLSFFIDIVGGAGTFASIFAMYNTNSNSMVWITPFIAYLIIRQIDQLYITKTNPIQSIASSYMGQIFVTLPFILLTITYFLYGSPIVLALFLMLWLNDTGAYCVGSLLGKKKLFERISPKKSWEGFWGGLIFCVIAAVAFSTIFAGYFGDYTLTELIIYAIIVSVIGTYGDLCESLIKRTLNVKDSGKILPGHGGILDRIDSLLLAAPATLLYLLILKQFFK